MVELNKPTIEKILELVDKEYRPVTMRQFQIATIYATARVIEDETSTSSKNTERV